VAAQAEDYVSGAPSPQYALDLFANEWTSGLPLEGYRSGHAADLFKDARIEWLIEQLGGIEGMRVLELGPLEGGHTYSLEQAGAAEVIGVEANKRGYMKCLITKELLNMSRSHFLLGDFTEYLAETSERFDLIVASGVLYHAFNPVQLLYLLATAAPRVFVWTHYYDPHTILARPELAERFSASFPSEEHGFRHMLYRYQYSDDQLVHRGFCGGPRPASHWLEQQAILDAFRTFGLTNIVTSFEHPEHPHGPSFAFLAQRGESGESGEGQ
jgi:hypothetical protein